MIIRKLFKYEMSHRVYRAYTRRCSHNIHGHSYKLELLFSGTEPDNAQMVMDFSFVKKYFQPFVDSFDHAHMIWDISLASKEKPFIEDNNERYVVAPFSSTAEMQAKMFMTYCAEAIKNLKNQDLISFDVFPAAAIVHETDTGYAQYNIEHFNTCKFPVINLKDIKFSPGCIKDWSPEFLHFYNKLVENQDYHYKS